MRWFWPSSLRPGDIAAVALAVVLGGCLLFAFRSPLAFNKGFGPQWDCGKAVCIQRPPADSADQASPSGHDATE
jgi:hypothetical protein